LNFRRESERHSESWFGLAREQRFPANFWGLVTGEWKGAPRRVYGYLGAGLSVMIAALVIIALGARA